MAYVSLFDKSITTASLEIGVLEDGCGRWKSRQRQTGVEMEGIEIYFLSL
jgi:hypothetical protein